VFATYWNAFSAASELFMDWSALFDFHLCIWIS